MSTSFLPTFWFHSDIVDLQTRLSAAITTTNASVTACTTLDTATATAWANWYAPAAAFCAESAAWINTGQQADVGQGYEKDLVAWQRLLAGKKCPVPGTPYAPPGQNGQDPTDNQTLKWIVVGVSIVGVAYIVGEIAPHVPYASRASEGCRRTRRLSARSPRALRGR